MLALYTVLLCMLFTCIATIQATIQQPDLSLLGCKGGTIYFSAHPVDCLLFQNPDLLYDLYVFKCTTTVVFTSGNHGDKGNYSASLERGLEESHALMAGFPTLEVNQTESRVHIENYDIQSWTLHPLDQERRAQILFLRLPDSLANSDTSAANSDETLLKLYNGDIKNIATIDGATRYSLQSLKDLIVTILLAKKPQTVRVLNHKASLPQKKGKVVDHVDHVVVSRLVQEVIEHENITTTLQGYAGNFASKLVANLNTSESAFRRKGDAFFAYARHDAHMCQNLSECKKWLNHGKAEGDHDDDARYAAKYLEREYYVS